MKGAKGTKVSEVSEVSKVSKVSKVSRMGHSRTAEEVQPTPGPCSAWRDEEKGNVDGAAPAARSGGAYRSLPDGVSRWSTV